MATVTTCVASCAANPGPPPVVDPAAEQPPAAADPADTTTPAPEPKPEDLRTSLVVGIDAFHEGFNPHLISNDTAFVQQLAGLVLPSAYVNGELNTDVVTAVDTLPAELPAAQVVKYTINPEAQWNDGTPITGADFEYLWQSMISTPAVIDPAAYESIDSVTTADGGKSVTVVFNRQVKDISGLFNNLVPAHLMRPDSAGFGGAMNNAIPASAGRFAVKAIDRQRGVITVVRNDRFWADAPAIPEELSFRTINSTTQGAQMLRSGQLGFAELTPAETSADFYRLVPGTQVRTHDRDSQLGLTFNLNSPLMGNIFNRAAVARILDGPGLARLTAGRSAQLSLPAPSDYPDLSQVPAAEHPTDLALLTARRPFRIAADSMDEKAIAASEVIADMLRAGGMFVETISTPIGAVVSQELPEGTIDALVSWQRTDTAPTTLASRYHCPRTSHPSLPAQQDPDGTAPTSPTASATEAASKSKTRRPAAPDSPQETATHRSGNLAGFCNADVDATLEQALAGKISSDHAVDLIGPTVRGAILKVPIMNDRRLDILGSTLQGPTQQLEKWPLSPSTGLIGTAPIWQDRKNR